MKTNNRLVFSSHPGAQILCTSPLLRHQGSHISHISLLVTFHRYFPPLPEQKLTIDITVYKI